MFSDVVAEVQKRTGQTTRKQREEIAKHLREALNVIMDVTSSGERIRLMGFGDFNVSLRRSKGINTKGRQYLRIYLKVCDAWRRRLCVEKNMEKYGVELDKNKGTKLAAEKGKCPACGKTLSGNPPICPACGSKPLEKRRKDA